MKRLYTFKEILEFRDRYYPDHTIYYKMSFESGLKGRNYWIEEMSIGKVERFDYRSKDTYFHWIQSYNPDVKYDDYEPPNEEPKKKGKRMKSEEEIMKSEEELGCLFALIIAAIIGIVVIFFMVKDINSPKGSLPVTDKNNPMYWTDNPEIEFTIFLNHNNYATAKVLHLSANMFNTTTLPMTNKVIIDSTISMLNKRRTDINDSVRAEFQKIHVNNGNCHDEVIDGTPYFVCQIN